MKNPQENQYSDLYLVGIVPKQITEINPNSANKDVESAITIFRNENSCSDRLSAECALELMTSNPETKTTVYSESDPSKVRVQVYFKIFVDGIPRYATYFNNKNGSLNSRTNYTTIAELKKFLSSMEDLGLASKPTKS
jgi:hypothetical protein